MGGLGAACGSPGALGQSVGREATTSQELNLEVLVLEEGDREGGGTEGDSCPALRSSRASSLDLSAHCPCTNLCTSGHSQGTGLLPPSTLPAEPGS